MRKKQELQLILKDIDEHSQDRQQHTDRKIAQLQQQIDGIKRSNFNLLLRLHKRMIKQGRRIDNDKNVDLCADTFSDEEEATGDDDRFVEFAKWLDAEVIAKDDDNNGKTLFFLL